MTRPPSKPPTQSIPSTLLYPLTLLPLLPPLILLLLTLFYPPNTPSTIFKLHTRIQHVSTISTTPHYLSRPYLSNATTHLRDIIREYMRDANLSVNVDDVGNIIGRVDCNADDDDKKVVIVGGHLDSVENGGVWDGMYGLLGGIEAVGRVGCGEGGLGGLSVEVVGFDGEEGGDWGDMMGSKGYVGRWEKGEVEGVVGRVGFVERYLEGLGGDGGREEVVRRVLGSGRGRWEEVRGFLEVHVEQGPVLEKVGVGLGVVKGIFSQVRGKVRVEGMGGHAGTVPMELRRDALVGAAEVVVGIEEIARGLEGRGVATVGKIEVLPVGVGNVIPGMVGFDVDVRAETDSLRDDVKEKIITLMEEVGTRRSLKVDFETLHEAGAVGMNGEMSDLAEKAVATVTGRQLERTPSGAGHDAMILASVTDVAMMFLRCRDGVSHHPSEHVSREDAELGVDAIEEFLRQVARTV